jgi:hypothetical protein
MGGCLVSVACQTSGVPLPQTPKARQSKHWTQVATNPPTYYPRGVPADCDSDFHSGEWVYTENDSDTRFFIPFKGIPPVKRQALLQEALALRSERKRNQIDTEGKLNATTAGAAATAVALAPVVLPVFVAAEVLGTFVPWIYEPAWVRDAKATRGHSSTQPGN